MILRKHENLLLFQKNDLCFKDLITAYIVLARMSYPQFPNPNVHAHTVNTLCFQYDIEIQLDASSILNALETHTLPTSLELKLAPSIFPKPKVTDQDRANNVYIWAYTNVFSQSFLSFFEKCKPIFLERYGKPNKYPSATSFGNLVRNAFAHDGKVSFDKKNKNPISWRSLKFSQSDNGKPLLYSELSNGDLIMLMAEICDELEVNCALAN